MSNGYVGCDKPTFAESIQPGCATVADSDESGVIAESIVAIGCRVREILPALALQMSNVRQSCPRCSTPVVSVALRLPKIAL